MEYKLTPYPIFENYVIKNSNVSEINKHKLIKGKKEVYFKADSKVLPYYDHIEMSGLHSSLILSYGADEKKNFIHSYHIVFPSFRRKNNDTRGSFSCRIKNPIDLIINDCQENEKLQSVSLNGIIKIDSKIRNIKISRKIIVPRFPGVVTLFTIQNTSHKVQRIEINCPLSRIDCDKEDYYERPYHIEFDLYNSKTTTRLTSLVKVLKPGDTFIFYLSISCQYDDEIIKNKKHLSANALLDRNLFLMNMDTLCQLSTGNEIIDTLFYFAKIRASESIFLTKNGLMHSPGGGNYYAATWNNDQCEYASPFFGYLNYNIANQAMINCFQQYEKYMYRNQPLVCSIIAEGEDYWNGAKDRGDAAMYVYGLTRFLLTYGDKKLAKHFIKPIQWCIQYSLSKKNSDGLIESDSDELENRFESGNCNLATNSIFYQALLMASKLFSELGIENDYETIASQLKKNINSYFYDDHFCYYCKEETHQRSHIVYPLIMGIYEHSEQIIQTIMSDDLYTENGFKTIDNCDTYWDRITLMAIRGIFNAHQPDLAYDILLKYSENRLLKDHVPYAIEAYPEGNQAHLAAENALYARIYIEGILGFEPVSFQSFSLHLSMPSALKYIKVSSFYYSKRTFSIFVQKEDNHYLMIIPHLHFRKKVKNFEEVMISFAN